jgi:hypothetical protein
MQPQYPWHLVCTLQVLSSIVQVLIKGQACFECENGRGETAAASLTAVKFRNRVDPSDAEPGRSVKADFICLNSLFDIPPELQSLGC